MGKTKYNVGDKINGILFIADTVNSPKRVGLFECPFCGKHYETRVDSVANKHSTHCGCQSYARHYNTTSDGYRSETYKTWACMMARCYGNDPSKQESYRDKGIVVCERWHDFNNFLADVGERPKGKTIDRFPDKNGNYGPDNFRWATPKEQQRNLSNNLLVTYNGETKTLPEWCELLNLNYHRVRERIFIKGMQPEMAFVLKKRDPSLFRSMKQTVLVEYRGESKSLAEWTHQLGLSYELMRNRIRKLKWTPEDAFTIPAFDRKEGGRINKDIYKASQPVNNFIPHSFGFINA